MIARIFYVVIGIKGFAVVAELSTIFMIRITSYAYSALITTYDAINIHGYLLEVKKIVWDRDFHFHRMIIDLSYAD